MVKSETELLYWTHFTDYIHYDEDSDTYIYDPELPQRARESFEAWLKQCNDQLNDPPKLVHRSIKILTNNSEGGCAMSVLNERFAFVPIDGEGIQDCECMNYDTDHVIMFELPNEEFWKLYNSGVISKINNEAELMIDDYEEERIPRESLAVCNQIINEEGIYKNGTFVTAIRTAINYGTFVDFCF